VGFSYSDNPADYTVGDWRTASDNYIAILQWLERFPQYATTDFFFMAESYGGHYAPTLAKTIVEGNNAGGNAIINFKGFLVGNPLTDMNENAYGAFGTFHGHALISKPTWDGIYDNCFAANNSELCDDYENDAENEIGDLDPYGLDFPVCLPAGDTEPQRLLSNLRHARPYLGRSTQPQPPRIADDYAYDPCRDNYTVSYVNQPSVIAAIHANPNLPYAWAECSNILNYNVTDVEQPMEPIYQWLLANANLHITVYSGDDDSVCATLGTQLWMYDLGQDVVADWAPWTDLSGQVGGYTVAFDGLRLVTVHSAGHMVPSFQPQRAAYLLSQYLANKW